ncbi:MAG: HlyD family type I secretion periplasmic adaptor subunit [Thiogranum sp.]|nr:HlyD family type I secretion periplasmic adaptor subunit [Thiogranum sp.]
MKRELLEFLPAVLEIQTRPPSPAGRIIAWSVIAFLVLAVAWAVVGETELVATAQGVIIPGGRVKLIQPVEGGKVRALHVQDDQHVAAGALLIELDSTRAGIHLARIEEQLQSARLDVQRYRRLRDLLVANPVGAAISMPVAEGQQPLDPLIVVQDSLLLHEWSQYHAQVAALRHAATSQAAEWTAVRASVDRVSETLPLITRRAAALRTLVNRQHGSEQNWLELEQLRVDQRQTLAELRSRVRQVEASVDEAEQRVIAFTSGFHAEVLNGLVEASRRLGQLQQQQEEALHRLDMHRLTAPVDGVVQQLAVHTVGAVLDPGEVVMKIVPLSGSLQIEAWLANRDVGFVTAGQAADVKIETFTFTRYGTLDAKVIAVSGDAVSDENRGLVYAVRVAIENAAMQVGEQSVSLTPGMAVTVDIKTGKRRLIEYFLSPLLRYRQESLRER